MKKISTLIVFIVFLVTACDDPLENQTKNSPTEDVSRFFFEDEYYEIPKGSSLELELESHDINVTHIFYSSTDFTISYIFNSEEACLFRISILDLKAY